MLAAPLPEELDAVGAWGCLHARHQHGAIDGGSSRHAEWEVPRDPPRPAVLCKENRVAGR